MMTITIEARGEELQEGDHVAKVGLKNKKQE